MAPLDISSQIQFNAPVAFTSEALDCAYLGQVSDIYLLFR